ncbi:NAD(P)H-dependent oxidoreductase [Bacillus sp. FJAT-49705]|uniref:NAD(P)H-dependent oxidoreductase n=1 Tax=Cytobacillus citreus TaxID=2833586 RepID=A0ABS5NX78_9BACI|nr:NAD(P)H-dependent oxidoreductase [Cytobacillus citreus]MBS4192397.1 NAD(P)H-dependent oxidoreductase [Cytobacillus citreus]
MKILGISGTITGSKTLIVINKVMDEIKKKLPEAEVEVLDLKKYNVQFCDGRPPSDYSGDTRKVIEIISSADSYIFGTPIFQGSFTGALKNLIDLVPPSEFSNKVIGFVATGGNNQHYLVIENQLKPIAGYLNAYVAPSFVFAHNSHFNARNEIADSELLKNIEMFSHQIAFMHANLIQQKMKTVDRL